MNSAVLEKQLQRLADTLLEEKKETLYNAICDFKDTL